MVALTDEIKKLSKEQKWMLSRALAGLYKYNPKYRDIQIYRAICLFRSGNIPKSLPDAKICFAMFEDDYMIVCASNKKWDQFDKAEIVWYNKSQWTKSVGANRSAREVHAQKYAEEWIAKKTKQLQEEKEENFTV
jgi:hypothetical protein